MMKKTLLSLALITGASSYALADEETSALKQQLAEQQQQLQALEQRILESEQKLVNAAAAIDASATSQSATRIGGYGELHYNNISNNLNNTDNKQIDFHRFVLFMGHEFDENTRFFSEVELEHSIAGEDAEGEIELEQAYIERDINDRLTGKAGLFLVPVGIINETHEPPAFYGVERNSIEKDIIPATWWEAGVAANFKLAPGIEADFAVTSGLNVGSDYKIRGGRQKVSEAKADNLAYTSRVKYTAIPGVELAASLQYQSDLTQGLVGVDTASATLFSAHAIYQRDGLGLKALYARWDIDGAEAKALGRDLQQGYYIEPSYRFNERFGVFARYGAWDNTAGINGNTEIQQSNLGVNYWLHENVVVKFDLERQSGAADADGFNLGLGYQF